MRGSLCNGEADGIASLAFVAGGVAGGDGGGAIASGRGLDDGFTLGDDALGDGFSEGVFDHHAVAFGAAGIVPIEKQQAVVAGDDDEVFRDFWRGEIGGAFVAKGKPALVVLGDEAGEFLAQAADAVASGIKGSVVVFAGGG